VPKRAIKPTPISNKQQLSELAQNINEHHLAVKTAFESMVRHAEAAGRDLIQAKDQVRHGGWEDWVTEHTDVSLRTASNYMRIARELPKLDEGNRQRVADLSLRHALQELSDWPVPYAPKGPGVSDDQRVVNITATPQEKSAVERTIVVTPRPVPDNSEQSPVSEYIPPKVAPQSKPTAFCRDLDDAVVSMSDANLLAALRLIDNAEVNTLARVAKLDDEINLEELAAHLADAAVRAA
jgi:hypothetical protein